MKRDWKQTHPSRVTVYPQQWPCILRSHVRHANHTRSGSASVSSFATALSPAQRSRKQEHVRSRGAWRPPVTDPPPTTSTKCVATHAARSKGGCTATTPECTAGAGRGKGWVYSNHPTMRSNCTNALSLSVSSEPACSSCGGSLSGHACAAAATPSAWRTRVTLGAFCRRPFPKPVLQGHWG